MRCIQALAFVLCTWAAAVFSLAQSDAFTVTSEPVHPSSNPVDPHTMLEQRYVVAQPFVDHMINRASLQTLKIALPGRVFVSYNYDLSSPRIHDWSALPAAIVRFSGSSEAVFKYFEVVSTDAYTVEVRRRASEHSTLEDAYLLTEISLSQSHAITEVITSGSGDVVIEDQVVACNAPSLLTLKHSGSGALYVDTKSASLTSAHVSSSGTGGVFWTGGALQIESLKLELGGSGGVTMQSQVLTTTALEVAAAGSGNICVDASEDMQATTLFASLAGSGMISLSAPAGHCTREDITILGSGDVLLGALQCEDVKVTVAGSGDTTVQATRSISGSAYGSGEVHFVGATPERISDRHDANVFSREQSKKYRPIAKHKARNNHLTCATPSLPTRSAVRVNSYVWSATMDNSSTILVPLVFLAVLSLCYLRRQIKGPRRRRRDRAPRYGSYRPNGPELQPLQPMQPPAAYHPQGLYQPQPPQPQQQHASTQVYV